MRNASSVSPGYCVCHTSTPRLRITVQGLGGSSIVPSWSASQLVVLVAVTACTESAGPAPGYDPAELRSSLAAVDTVFASPLARSVGVFLYGAPIPPPVAAAPLIPDSLLGRTFAWSCDTRRYVLPTLSAARARGRRPMLYL